MSVVDTSKEAFTSLAGGERKHQADVILDIVTGACRNGAADLSLREIAQRYHLVHGKPIDVGTVSGRVTSLVASHRLVRLNDRKRPCTQSGKTVAPVTVPATQVRLF